MWTCRPDATLVTRPISYVPHVADLDLPQDATGVQLPDDQDADPGALSHAAHAARDLRLHHPPERRATSRGSRSATSEVTRSELPAPDQGVRWRLGTSAGRRGGVAPDVGAYGSSVEEIESAADEAFWTGYLAALEEVDSLDTELRHPGWCLTVVSSPSLLGAAVRHGLVPVADVRAGRVHVRPVSRSNPVHVIEQAGVAVGYVKQSGTAARARR